MASRGKKAGQLKLDARKLARDIADQIEKELQYPGEIKINVIRENRVIEYAR